MSDHYVKILDTCFNVEYFLNQMCFKSSVCTPARHVFRTLRIMKMKHYILIITLSFSYNLFALTLGQSLNLIQQEILKNSSEISAPERNLKLYYQGHFAKCSVVITHGLFQSPFDMQGLANLFYQQGCNVISGLLPGHWRKDSKAFYKINEQNWVEAHQQWLNFAKPLGKNLIVVGHSLGGLLSFRAALLNPDFIQAALYLSPALELNPLMRSKIFLGDFLNVDLDQYSKNLDPFYKTAKPARAGTYVVNLILDSFSLVNSKKIFNRDITYQSYKVPSLIISTEDDDVISDSEVKNFYSYINADKNSIFYVKDLGVFHDNIQRSKIDLLEKDPDMWRNPYFSEQAEKITQFLLPYLK